jgi:hypothetical protein
VPFPCSSAKALAVAVAVAVAVAAAGSLAACSPALNWRDVRAPGGVARLQLPCRPASQSRKLALAGGAVTMNLLVCDADGQTWALGWATLADASRADDALRAWRASAAARVAAREAVELPLTVRGATLSPAAVRLALQGSRPAGAAIELQLGLFRRGATLYQATVLGDKVSADAAQTFFASIRLDS